MPIRLRDQIDGGSVRPQRQVPAMDLLQLRAPLDGPSVILLSRASADRQRQRTANTVVIAAREAKHVRNRSVGPRNIKRRRAKPRRSAPQVTRKMNRPRLLHDHGGTPG